MDKINLNDKETLEKLRDYLDTTDLTEEELIEVVESMTDEQKERIFDLFYQADYSRSGEGFGIGLALSKEIVDSLGAKITVLDNKSSGSTFVISFLTEN